MIRFEMSAGEDFEVSGRSKITLIQTGIGPEGQAAGLFEVEELAEEFAELDANESWTTAQPDPSNRPSVSFEVVWTDCGHFYLKPIGTAADMIKSSLRVNRYLDNHQVEVVRHLDPDDFFAPFRHGSIVTITAPVPTSTPF